MNFFQATISGITEENRALTQLQLPILGSDSKWKQHKLDALRCPILFVLMTLLETVMVD
jgi:hypothetical protein